MHARSAVALSGPIRADYNHDIRERDRYATTFRSLSVHVGRLRDAHFDFFNRTGARRLILQPRVLSILEEFLVLSDPGDDLKADAPSPNVE